jgi:hypothetical protein
MTDIDVFFDVVSREVAKQLDKIDPDSSTPTHWVAIEDKKGVELSSIESGEPHELLRSFMEQGVYAAAYVTHVPGAAEHILAYVVVAEPRNSDVRRSPVVRNGRSVALGPWGPTV